MEAQTIKKCLDRTMTEVWQTTLELPLTKVEDNAFTIPGEALTLTTITIDGTWAGSLDLLTTATLNAAIASSIYGTTENSEEDVQDALRELVNIVGGSLKTFLPEPSYLSLPQQSTTEADAADTLVSEAALAVPYVCDSEHFMLLIHKER